MASHQEFNAKTNAEQVATAFQTQISEKTILITGVNANGLGGATAVALAGAGPKKIIITARAAARAEDVAAKIRGIASEGTVLQVVILDLSSLSSVRAAAAEISRTNSVIDVQINNAGVMAIPARTLSEDGIEMQLATNFLGHFVLTQSLLPLLKAAVGGARVVNITSAGYVLTPFRFSDYNFGGEKALPMDEQVHVDTALQMGFAGTDPNAGYHPFITYAHSNVANMLFTKGLAEKYASEGVSSVCAEPGVVATELQRYLPSDFRNAQMTYKSPSQGAASFLVAALDPALPIAAKAPVYINHCQVSHVMEHARSDLAANKLWALAVKLAKFEEE